MSSARRERDRRGLGSGVIALVAYALATGCDPDAIGPQPSRAGTAELDASTDAASSSVIVAAPAPRLADAGSAAPSAPASVAPCFAEQFPFAFVSRRAPPVLTNELFLSTEDGSEIRRIGRSAHFASPTWAPDGSAIAFRRLTYEEPGFSYVALVGPTGEPFVQLTEPEPFESLRELLYFPDGPTWSSDSRQIAYAARHESAFHRVWIMSRSGGRRRLLLPDLDLPHHHVSFARHDPALLALVIEAVDGSDIWTVNVEAPDERENLTRGRVVTPRWPRWSPDGARLVFAAEVAAPDAGEPLMKLFVLDRERDTIEQVTHGDGVDGHPAWLPDGRALLFARAQACAGPIACMAIFRFELENDQEPVALTSVFDSFWPDWYGGGPCGGR